MDKLTTISAALFMAADVCAIVSLAMPDWIVTSVGGMCGMDAPKLFRECLPKLCTHFQEKLAWD